MTWLASFHIIGLIVWLGGLITLGRLLGHHASLESAEARKSLIDFERKSYFFAVLPGFLVALITGLVLLMTNGGGPANYFGSEGGWGMTFHLKMTLVIVLIVLDQLVGAKMRKLHSEDQGSRAFFMATHGIIALIMILIVVMVKTNILGG